MNKRSQQMHHIEPGTYKLNTDIHNPAPDRRVTRDWRRAPVWKKDTEFIVVEKRRDGMLDEQYLATLPEETRTKIVAASRYTVVQLVGDRWPGIHEIGPGHDEQYAILAKYLCKTEESLEAFLMRLDAHTNNFAAWLLETGKLTRELFES